MPVVEIDADGEVITGYIVADNYYEMWVNGKLVSVDNTPYTPFNSAIVKFKVKRPYTMAFLLVDWDEHLGLGMEQFPVPVTPATTQWYPGDGGLIAKFSDGTMTDSSWKAQCFAVHYPSPENWQSPRFNDTNWPRAWEFTDQEIGVTALPAYTRYPELFDGARWIWSQNLVLDNVVIARKTVR